MKNAMRKWLIVLVGVLAIASVLVVKGLHPDQRLNKEHSDNAVRLKSRMILPPQGVEKDLIKHIQMMQREKINRVHVLVQFKVIPDIQGRKRLEETMKMILLDPIPERAFYVSIPANVSVVRDLVGKSLVRWVQMIRQKDKVAPWILEKGVPGYAKPAKGKAELIVEFFGDVSEKDQEKALKKQGAEFVNRIPPLNGWHVILNEADIIKLAGEDPVKWIVEIPLPPQEDNDGVRSATGINADPVYPPSKYGLSGSGVTVAQWEPTHASFAHSDYMARVTLADPPVPRYDRGYMHDESIAANGRYNDGERIYWDMDDSGTVTAGDVRATTVGAYAPGSVVTAGPPADTDVGTALVSFVQWPYEGFADTITTDWMYTAGEGIYFDNDVNGKVSAGDTRLTPLGVYAAGSTVSGGSAGPPPVPADTDVGQTIYPLSDAPHGHATHVAGTLLGDGSRSAAHGGTPFQWQGVAPGANLRSYSGYPITGAAPGGMDEYTNAANNGVSLSTNSWGASYYNAITSAHTGYEIGSQYYDAIISGRRSDGTATGLPRRILIVGSAGNNGSTIERYVDNNPANGQYDNGEAIYRDVDRNGIVSNADVLCRGTAQSSGTALSNFYSAIMHDETINAGGTYNDGEGIYIDADSTRTVNAGDTRIVAPAGSGFANGSVVAAGDADVNRLLKWFRPFASVRIPNSAKNTIEVANIASDTSLVSATSSRGLTYEGRFKPDVAGPGWEEGNDFGVTSTWPRNSYATITGTSMSTPAVSGCAALLEEWYMKACSNTGPSPDMLRALLIHSAADLTNIPNVGNAFAGPDFAFGYGRVRIKEAVDLMPHFLAGTATTVGSIDRTVTIGAMDAIKVTIVWNDPPWVGSANPSAVTGILHNDLDLLLIAPDGTQYTPWVANNANLFAPASRSVIPAGNTIPASAEDHRNTVEQVLVDNAQAGTWTIRVKASSLNLPPQDYVLVSETLPPNSSMCTANPPADVWVKDNPSDTGTVPSTGAMYLGPDVWNRLSPDGLTDHENPEFGQTNYLYANIRNNSAVEVKSTVLDAWIGSLTVGLIWPDAFVYIGRFNIPNLAPGEIRQVGPLEWLPKEVGHHCMYTRVSSPQDPITFVETSSVWTNAMNSNNIAYRNMEIVDLASSKSVSFLVRNTKNEEAELDILIDVPDELLAKGEVRMMLSPELEKRWPNKNRAIKGLGVIGSRPYISEEPEREQEPKVEKSRAATAELPLKAMRIQFQRAKLMLPTYRITTNKLALKGLAMLPRQMEKMTLTFASDQTTKAVYNVYVTQIADGAARDGILLVVRTGYAKRR